MNKYQRNNHLLSLLRQVAYVSVEELSSQLDVSPMTIRRDLKELEEMGIIARSHGGASLKTERGDTEWPLELRKIDHADIKERIGQAAARLVHDGDVVILDSGTTTLPIANHLSQNRLTVASNFLPILDILSQRRNMNLIGIGGLLYPENQSFVGNLAVNTIRSINANLTIIATSCLSYTTGLTCRNFAEADVKRAMIEVAEKVILVMDASKMHKHTLASFGSLDNLDIIVTDDRLLPQDWTLLQERGINVITVPSSPQE